MADTAPTINQTPQSLEEWNAYVSGMSGLVLLEQAQAANTPGFVRTLLDEEGYGPGEVTEILRMFAMQLENDDQAVPSRVPGAYLDLASLLDTADLEAVEVD